MVVTFWWQVFSWDNYSFRTQFGGNTIFLCLFVGNWTRSDRTTLQNNILLIVNVKLPGTLISLLSLELSDQVMWALLDSDSDFTFHRWFVTARSSACPSKIITLSPFQVPNALLWSVYLWPHRSWFYQKSCVMLLGVHFHCSQDKRQNSCSYRAKDFA